MTGATAGATYYFSVKYDTSTLTGTPVKKPYPTVNYTFQTWLNGVLRLHEPGQRRGEAQEVSEMKTDNLSV